MVDTLYTVHLISRGISIRTPDSLVIPEKVTAVWTHNEAGIPADHNSRLQTLLHSIGRMEAACVCFGAFEEDDGGSVKCVHDQQICSTVLVLLLGYSDGMENK